MYYGPLVEKMIFFACENKGADQHRYSLITAFVIYFSESIVTKLAPCMLSIFQLVSVADQPGLSLALTESQMGNVCVILPLFCLQVGNAAAQASTASTQGPVQITRTVGDLETITVFNLIHAYQTVRCSTAG